MNIYGHINKAIKELDNNIFNLQEVEEKHGIEGIKKSWNYIQKYMKNIYPDFVTSFEKYLDTLTENEVVITKDMVNEAYSTFKIIKEEQRIDVKSFMLRYMWVMERLLIFHKPDEACRVCQGHLHYYYDSEQVIKLCSTCSMAFKLNDEVIPPKSLSESLRPAKKDELLKVM